MKASLSLLALAAGLLNLPVHASELDAVLPPAVVVERVLAEHPEIQAGARGISAGQAERRRLEAGDYEWTVRSEQQKRRVHPAGENVTRYREWNVALERPFRILGKAGMDAELGSLSEQSAELAAGDARHNLSRELLRLWFAWLRDSAQESLWQEQSASLEKQRQTVDRRVQLGDASRLELAQITAAQTQAAVQLAQAGEQRQASELRLGQQFPGLPLVLPKDLPTPPALGEPTEELVAHLLEHDHELELAKIEAQRMTVSAKRTRRDRIPDPTVGLQYGKEHGGEENLVTAFISWPLPGQARAASADRDQALAAAASLKAEALQRRLASEARTLILAARQSASRWQLAASAHEHQAAAATMSLRAWQLGEGSLNDLLLATRLANETRIAARLQQLEALELHARVRVDAHQIWSVEDEDAH